MRAKERVTEQENKRTREENKKRTREQKSQRTNLPCCSWVFICSCDCSRREASMVRVIIFSIQSGHMEAESSSNSEDNEVCCLYSLFPCTCALLLLVLLFSSCSLVLLFCCSHLLSFASSLLSCTFFVLVSKTDYWDIPIIGCTAPYSQFSLLFNKTENWDGAYVFCY